MGVVHRALDTSLNRSVALKFLTGHDEGIDRFLREARAASALNYPNIVTIHEIGEAEGGRYLVMEWIDGVTLRVWTREPRPLEAVLSVVQQVAKALAAAHAAGITHRDIKPENLMVRPDGYVKVLDFGLAQQVTGEEAETLALTQPGTLLGTLRYMSPEQSRGEPAHASSDIFSLGLVLYELVTGRHPFQAGSTIGVLHGIQSRIPAPLPLDHEPALNDLVMQMLEKDAGLRPAAADVAARLSSLPARAQAVAFVPRRRNSVGRERERAELRAAFQAADSGAGQMVAVAGESGIGKSTLVEDFLSEIAAPAWIARGRCSERLAGAEAHLPFLEALDSLLERDCGVVKLMSQFAPSWYVQIAPLSAEDSSAARLLAETKTGSAERLMREMAALLQELARQRPVVLFIDDLHWADVSTIDLLGYLAAKLARLRALILVTYRPTDLTVSKHPFLRLKTDLAAHGTLREVAVAFLKHEDVEQYLAQHLPEAPAGLAALIYNKTEGNPLFMVDVVHYLRERGEPSDWVTEIERNIPESLRGMIDRKLEHLAEDERQLLRVAAVQGVQFDSAILADVLGHDPADVEEALQSLDRVHGLVKLEREQEFPNRVFSLRYQFVHVLYQNALYASLPPSRRASWSGKVAAAVEAAYGERKSDVAAELALLYETARDAGRASEHFLAAAEVASSRFATREVVALAQRGLACLAAYTDSTEAKHRELALRKALLTPLASLEGWGSSAAECASQRVIELSEHLGDTSSLFAALQGLTLVHVGRAEFPAAAKTSERMLAIADQSGSDVQQMNTRMWAMFARHHMGELTAAQHHAEVCIALGTPQNQAARLITIYDPVVGALAHTGRLLWMMGENRRSIDHTERAVELARRIRHPDSLSFALLFRGLIHGFLEDWDTCLRSTAEAISVGTEHGLVQTLAWNHGIHGWALACMGNISEGLVELEEAIENYAQIMGQTGMPHFMACLAEVLMLRGEHTRALENLQRVLKENETHRELFFDAELHRLAAECYLAIGQSEAAEAALEQAIRTAAAQGAKTLELRAATTLGRLWTVRGEKRRAHALLQPISDALNDREATVDLRRARQCLMEWT